MGKSKKVFDYLDEKLSLSRRSFLGGMAAVGATIAAAGCTKDGANDIVYGGGEWFFGRSC